MAPGGMGAGTLDGQTEGRTASQVADAAQVHERALPWLPAVQK